MWRKKWLAAACGTCNKIAMKLSDYLAQPGVTASALAEKCEVSPSTITRTAKGEMLPSLTLIRLIIEHTGGAVTAVDLVEAA